MYINVRDRKTHTITKHLIWIFKKNCTYLSGFKKIYSEIFKIRNANIQTGNTLSDYLKWCNFLSEKRKKITAEVQVQITIFGVSVYMWCFHWQHNAIISTREKFSSFKRDPVYNVGSSVQFIFLSFSLLFFAHCTMCDFHNFGLSGVKNIFLKTLIWAFQKTLILAFEVIVQLPEYT